MDNETCNSLADVRAQIDRIDGQMVKLIAERSGYVSLAARFKSRREEVVDRERIEKVVAAARSLAAELGLEPDLVEQVFRAMIDRFVAFEFREFDRIHGAPAASGDAE
ncbi:MAG: chorismate mutase [Alphaproteobacteria bacterium]